MTKSVSGQQFLNQSVWLSEIVGSYNLCDYAVFCALHDQLASLGRHAQLMRSFSAVAELLVYKSYGQESCIKKGVLKVAQFKGVIQIYQTPTLVAMLTKIWKFSVFLTQNRL